MKCLLFCSTLILAVATAEAQNSPAMTPERIAPSGGTTLSEQLSKGREVVAPPKTNADPGMTVSPPNRSGSHMPVIPAPGSPGGNTRVIPR